MHVQLAVVVVVALAYGAWGVLKGHFRVFKPSKKRLPERVRDVSRGDVERIVHRDFAAGEFTRIIAALDEFDNKWESVRIRVQLAALKLADGNLEALKKYIAVANHDYWDVISLAEFHESRTTARNSGPPKELSKKERQLNADRIWLEYEDWLRRQ